MAGGRAGGTSRHQRNRSGSSGPPRPITLTSRAAVPASGRDGRRSCACGSRSSWSLG